MAIATPEMAQGASPVATRDSYIGYKQDTRHLVEWMVKTTNHVLKAQPNSAEERQLPFGVSPSGATNVAGLVAMARLIADSGATVSGSIFSPVDRNYIEKSNDMHKHFIDSLIDIFSILGGVSWWDKQMEANKMTSKRPDSDAEQIEEMKGIIFSNKFALLDLSHGDSRTGDAKSQPPSEPESDAEEPAVKSKTAKKKRFNGKKGKGKASKSSRKSRKPVRNLDANEATVENYRILEDDQLLSYTMAVLSFRTEWAQIRHYVQDLWRDVAYRGLNTAIEYFQKSRNGKPTKAMRAKIGTWDPKLSLQSATKEERIQWRRKYTINWLYDLVNEYSAGEQTQRRERCFSDDVDWSPSGPSGSRRTLLGLTDFAAFVTSLVSQKTGSDISQKIFPRHVFQLQCLVDATAVQYSWSLCQHGGHLLEPPASEFHALRDINLIMEECPHHDNSNDDFYGHDPNCRHKSHVSSCKTLIKLLLSRHNVDVYNEKGLFKAAADVLSRSLNYLERRLGRCNSILEGATIPPSRFTDLEPHALWVYSPFLCGVGLAEALQILHSAGMRFMDIFPLPTLMKSLFRECVYVGGRWPDQDAPTADYVGALDAWAEGDITTSRLLRAKKVVEPPSTAVAYAVPVRENVNFNKVSHLMVYQEAGWDPSQIPCTSFEPRTAMSAVRLSREPMFIDGWTGQLALEPTEFVEHMNDNVGWHDDWLGQCGSLGDGIIGAIRAMDLLKPTKPSVARSAVEKDLSLAAYDKLETILEDLEIAEIDLWNDICGVRCRSAIDFTSVALRMIHIMDEVEKCLSPGNLNNQTFCKIYVPKLGKNPPIMDKNLRLIREAMIGKDEQILDTFIKKFEAEYCLSVTYMFWKENIQSPMIETGKKLGVEIPEWMGHCSVM
ncbi:hypothetical protein CGLO_12334 [Colletotrichum gloeosporioides Cg-14]|uniref:DUF6604 domain-containing protein n=1 Tax=Colletotrichum gloeosporioides (strain Cg-14) TaxID=1237896 RepID=T0K656_COLGC|nr:hypothetical protein CGLO_12334 [Colletotrichum gloeosporioides Cg-14]